MSTVVVELTNPKAINLLRDLESMQIIRLLHGDDAQVETSQSEPPADGFVEKRSTEPAKQSLRDFLLAGPVMSDEEMATYQQSRDWMNQSIAK
jgi:hypothetical protein